VLMAAIAIGARSKFKGAYSPNRHGVGAVRRYYYTANAPTGYDTGCAAAGKGEGSMCSSRR